MTEPHVAVLSQVQQFLDRQHGLYIDGRPGPAQSEKRLAIFDPATGQEIASTADANEADVDNAVMSAWRAFVSRRWAGRLPAERERILLRFADLVEQHSEELAQLETLEQGKSIAISRAFEVGCTLNWMRYTAGLTTKIAGKTLDLSIPLSPHYQLEVNRRGHLDSLSVKVELKESSLTLTHEQRCQVCHQLRHRIKSMVGISTDVMIVNCGSIPRSEGKACRVFDLRNIVGA